MLASRVGARSVRLIGTANSLNIVSSKVPKSIRSIRQLSSTTMLHKDEKRPLNLAARALDGDHSHEGSFGRTDNTIRIEHPDESEYPPSQPVQGRGGLHFKRTLASFTLEGGVAVVTGGARGLGLVMSQACVISGADVAIVDLNSKRSSLTLASRQLTSPRGRRRAPG